MGLGSSVIFCFTVGNYNSTCHYNTSKLESFCHLTVHGLEICVYVLPLVTDTLVVLAHSKSNECILV